MFIATSKNREINIEYRYTFALSPKSQHAAVITVVNLTTGIETKN